jgi:multicomponent Na+:H+ antiporter subunit C
MHALMGVLPYLVASWLFCCGLYGLVTSRHLVHSVVCLAVLQSSTYVLLLAVGYRTGATAPVLAGLAFGTPTVDPIVQALMLTDVVVEAVVVALLLAMVVKAHEKAGTVDPDDLRTMRG